MWKSGWLEFPTTDPEGQKESEKRLLPLLPKSCLHHQSLEVMRTWLKFKPPNVFPQKPVPLWEMGKARSTGYSKGGKRDLPNLCWRTHLQELSEWRKSIFCPFPNGRHKNTHPELQQGIGSALLDCSNKRNICYSPPLREFISLKTGCVNHSLFAFPLNPGRFSGGKMFISSFAAPVSGCWLLWGGRKARSEVSADGVPSLPTARWTEELRRRGFLQKKHGLKTLTHQFSKELTKVGKVPRSNKPERKFQLQSAPSWEHACTTTRRKGQDLLTCHFSAHWLLPFFFLTSEYLATSSPPGDISHPQGSNSCSWFLNCSSEKGGSYLNQIKHGDLSISFKPQRFQFFQAAAMIWQWINWTLIQKSCLCVFVALLPNKNSPKLPKISARRLL